MRGGNMGGGGFGGMLGGMRGPSFSSTIAVMNGVSCANPGCGALWTMPKVYRVASPLALIQVVSLEKQHGEMSLG